MSETSSEQRLHTIELIAGSLVVERYEYGTRSGGVGVQWLAEVVGKDGDLLLNGETPRDIDVAIVSRMGVAHQSLGYGVTDCGRDATGPHWWWEG